MCSDQFFDVCIMTKNSTNYFLDCDGTSVHDWSEAFCALRSVSFCEGSVWDLRKLDTCHWCLIF